MIGRSKEEHERSERKIRWKEKNHIHQEEMQHLHLQSQPVAPPEILPPPPTTVVAASGTPTAQPHANSWLHLLEGYSSFIVILSGQVLLVTSTIRYFRTAKAIKLGKYPTNKLGVSYPLYSHTLTFIIGVVDVIFDCGCIPHGIVANFC